MPTSLLEFTNNFFKAIENKDITSVIDFFSDNAELIDPHYPNPHMKGKKAITEGLNWSFKQLKRFSFSTVNYFETENMKSAAIEVISNHELANGRVLDTKQVIIFEIDDNKITRLQAYVPYGPDGIGGIILKTIRLIRKITGKQ